MLLGKKAKGFLLQLGGVAVFPMIFSLQAQPSEENGQDGAANDTPVQTQPAPVAPDKGVTVTTEETFTPTEDISEDSSVSYPVDI